MKAQIALWHSKQEDTIKISTDTVKRDFERTGDQQYMYELRRRKNFLLFPHIIQFKRLGNVSLLEPMKPVMIYNIIFRLLCYCLNYFANREAQLFKISFSIILKEIFSVA